MTAKDKGLSSHDAESCGVNLPEWLYPTKQIEHMLNKGDALRLLGGPTP